MGEIQRYTEILDDIRGRVEDYVRLFIHMLGREHVRMCE